jgi:RNA polymerase sigma-70 factor (ECF subfamily)
VAAAGVRDSVEAPRAFSELCGIYWFPLYAFARGRGMSPHDAEDATQSFLAGLAGDELLAQADRERGRLRSLLLQAFTRDMTDAHRRETARRRGGDFAIVPIDATDAEERIAAAAPGGYDRDWALTILADAMRRVEAEYAAARKERVFSALRVFLSIEEDAPKSDEAGAALGMSATALRQAVHRLRVRYGEFVRACIADTLREATTEAVDAELAALKAALRNNE